MAIYGVTYPNYPDYDQWEVHDEFGGSTSGNLSILVGQSVYYSAPFDRGFFCVARTSAKDHWSVYKTNLISGASSVVHEIGAIGGANTYDVFSLTVSPSGDDILVAYTSSTVGGYPLYLARSTDYGDTWSTATKPTFTNLDHVNYITLFRLASNPNVLYHSDGYDHLYPIYRSYDNGSTWSSNINIPPASTFCAARMPSVFLNYDTIILVSYIYSPALEYVYTLNLPTGVIESYLISDDGVFYAYDNNRHNVFGSYCRLNSQPPAETLSHGAFQDPPIFITESEVIFHSEAYPLIDTVKTQWQDVRACFEYPVQKVNGKTKTNSYIALNRNGVLGIISPRPSGNPYVDFFFNTGDEKLFGVKMPSTGSYPYGIPATWQLNDVNGLVSSGNLWAAIGEFDDPTILYGTAPFDNGFYSLSLDYRTFPAPKVFVISKTLVFADPPETAVVHEFPYALYSIRRISCSKNGNEVMVFCSGAAGAAPRLLLRSFDGGTSFTEFPDAISTEPASTMIYKSHRLDCGTNWPSDLIGLWSGDSSHNKVSTDFGATWLTLPQFGDLYNQLPSDPLFIYNQKIIHVFEEVGPIDPEMRWSVTDLITRASLYYENSGAYTVSDMTPALINEYKSFGCAILFPNSGTNPPVIATSNEIIYYNNKGSVLYGEDQPIRDCYGFALDKSYGTCHGASTVIFNEDGTIGLGPPIVGDFLIHLATTYSQFFTSFIETVETSLKPE